MRNPAITIDGKAFEPAIGIVRSARGRFVVPIEDVADALGVSVTERDGKVVVSRGMRSVELRPGSAVATVNGRRRRMAEPALRRNGTTLAPLRFLVESFGGQVRFDRAENVVNVRTEETGGACGLRVVGWR